MEHHSLTNDVCENVSAKILANITVFSKYAKYIPELSRRETWEEICLRNMEMHLRKFPQLRDEISTLYRDFVVPKKVLPSMRSMQFGGRPIELSNNRMFNCAFAAANAVEIFNESMFLLLGGSGLGYSVQNRHVSQLPLVRGAGSTTRRFLVGDSIEGWADAVKVLVEAYFFGKSSPLFDYRDVREKGAPLITSGGKAPGPEPLRLCIEKLRGILHNASGRHLSSLEVHDMLCHIADAVLSGGIRRAALIALFDVTDDEMLSCKSGDWYVNNPQRGRANNSAVLKRGDVDEQQFKALWKSIELSQCGEPGMYWTNDFDMGANPCVEIALNDTQFCNLTEINAHNVRDQSDLNDRARAAAFLGTIQASYVDFHYLRPQWREVTEREALIGVGITGVGSASILPLDLTEAARNITEENRRVANLIGINPAARSTCIKPSGTTSLAIGSSSGIHGWHNEYYIRRMRVGKNEALYHYMAREFPELIEDCKFKPHLEAVMSFPQMAPKGALLRHESPIDTLTRVKRFTEEWIRPGHQYGNNTHNVSCTISLKEEDWEPVGNWMWENREYYTGVSVLPYDGGTYVQAPFEDITEDQYDILAKSLHNIDLTKVLESSDQTNLAEQVACAGGACAI